MKPRGSSYSGLLAFWAESRMAAAPCWGQPGLTILACKPPVGNGHGIRWPTGGLHCHPALGSWMDNCP